MIAMVAAACSETPPDPELVSLDSLPPRVRSLAGCWRVERAGRPAGYAAKNLLREPVVVQLDSALDRHQQPLVFHFPVPRRMRRLSSWEVPQKRERVLMLWAEGHWGLDFRLAMRDGQLRGRAYELTDFRTTPWRVSTRVRATRTACPGPQDSVLIRT